jgi:quercetin dioxygenase-like cupin family protein
MTLQLPAVDVTVIRNEAYKSSGEDTIIVHADGQMTDARLIFHAKREQTNGAVLVTEIHWPPNDRSLHHTHELEDEGFYVIDGSLTLHAPTGDIELGPGEFGWAPRKIRHAYSVGPEGARVLLVQTPGTELTTFFRGIVDGGDLSGPGEFEELVEWSQTHFGIRFHDPAQYPPGQSIVDQETSRA